ncbi:MAG: ABC-type dipeptide/oligopeptide/nickel transport system, ATPase component [halophilic archaeon J07HX64]|jgi:ABC-type dipeptide/oligopeptide/nickel transport system, ATPase component|nr:MAG: ABC-type dipeptide/oligopeptide/nickel transport system, ATPase component [halophilic archaeon J07HX64]
MSETVQTAEAEPLLEVEDLRTVFRTGKETIHAVDGVSFDIRPGETVGLVGESGSGKSVTARSILGLIDSPGRVEDGAIRFRGENLVQTGWSEHRGDIAIVFQDPLNSINPVYTVGNQIREALRIHQGLTGSEARTRAVELLRSVGIPDAPRRVDEYPHQFSGGMQQRAVIAIALACDPDLLVCDEPTTALDVTIQAQILDLLETLQAEEELAILFITHDMGVIEETADRVNVIYAGEVVERAPTAELFDNPQHPYTRALLKSIPGRTAPGESLPTIEGEVPTPTEPAQDCRFAPRCPAATAACSRTHPEALSVDDETDHEAACLIHDDRHPEVSDSYDVVEADTTDTGGTTGGSTPSRGSASDGPLLEIRNLHTHYETGSVLESEPPVRAVDGVSFDIREGEILGLVGESGCGKTTLGRTLAGLETATEGSALAGDRDLTDLSGGALREWQRTVGFVFQDPEESLNNRMTVGQIVKEPLEAHDWGTSTERDERVFELLDQVGLLEEHFYRYPNQFSGGQRQRIGIARALSLEPEFLILDEPVSALDVSVQARVINLLQELQETLNITMLFIAHDLSVVRHITDRVAVMYLGNIMELGPTEAVFESPANPYTLSLLSAIPGSSSPAPSDLERVSLRGSPPNPRYPPDGCPFATRCPVKIRPEETTRLSPAAWEAIEAFRNLLNQRARRSEPITRSLLRRLGISSDGRSIDSITTELFEGVDLPPDVAETITAAEKQAGTDPSGAAALLAEEFGSVCDDGDHESHPVGKERQSRCVRHRTGYRDPPDALR